MIALNKINERVEIARHASDASHFLNLMYAGEQLMKLVTCGILAGISDKNKGMTADQYAFSYELVRADGLGVWARTLDAILTGPSAHQMSPQFNSFKTELTEKCSNPSWQFGAMFSLNTCVGIVNEKNEDLGSKVQLKNWFTLFSRLRNDARAHGIINAEQTALIAINLEKSLKLIYDNYSLLKAGWIYVKQNISGSYRFTALSSIQDRASIQSLIDDTRPDEGIYVCLESLFKVNLVESSIEATDFLFPNGNFKDKSYECISYITGRRTAGDSSRFLTPPGSLPKSQTEGTDQMEVVRDTFANLPSIQSIYINRTDLEVDLRRVLMFEDKYPVVTLSGRGGIGKTSLALHVLHEICNTSRFSAILWLSARDIDLLDEGPKTVKPQILDEADISKEFVKLVMPEYLSDKKFDQKKCLEDSLREVSKLGSLLLVMDNFETLRNPKQVYIWLETYIRNPNKILITSRLRDFKADYPIVVEGMSRHEFDALVEKVALKLEIDKFLTPEFLMELYSESDGHPYVVKMLLGEIAKQRGVKNIKRIVAGKDEILTALFERTYMDLSPAAQRIFLTLCSWRNILPEVAIQAVLNREGNELIDVDKGIDELHRYSFIELIGTITTSFFISVPLAAYEFGRKKLSVSPIKSKIQLDLQLLSYFGAIQFSAIEMGIEPRIEVFLRNITQAIKAGKQSLDRCDPILHFICRKYPQGWLLLQRIYSELSLPKMVVESLQNYVADLRISGEDKVGGLEMLATQYSIQSDHTAQAQTLVDICNVDNVKFIDLSNAVQILMYLFKENKTKFRKEETLVMLASVADKMKSRIMNEGSATDFTELAWVYLHLRNRPLAKDLVSQALEREPSNLHALNLARKLKIK